MNQLKILLLSVLAFTLVNPAYSQDNSDSSVGTLSPLSQFGIGLLTNPCTGFNSGMEGISYGMRGKNIVNPQNPASYSAIDSLTFIFDMGAYGQFSRLKQGENKINYTTGDLDYVTALFRVSKGVGVSFGFQPISQVGYDYTESSSAPGVSYTTSYHARHGGIQQYFIGVGWQPLQNLSVGMNLSYLHGDITRTVTSTSTEQYADSYTKVYNSKVSSYKLDLGVQGMFPLNNTDEVTVGATYTMGHNLGADQELSYTNTESSRIYTAEDALAIPHSIGIGASYAHSNKWKAGIDYSAQFWKALDYPIFKESGTFEMYSDYYKNRHRIAVGGEYCLNANSRRNFFDRIRYRAGLSYTTPYFNTNKGNGPKEFAASLGFGIPIMNGYNNRSILNLAVQWVNSDAGGFIKENSLRIKLGLTFNELWFMKWKVE